MKIEEMKSALIKMGVPENELKGLKKKQLSDRLETQKQTPGMSFGQISIGDASKAIMDTADNLTTLVGVPLSDSGIPGGFGTIINSSVPYIQPNPPSPGLSPTDPEWTNYVMTFFTENELVDKRPTCDGLRRVFERLVGEIQSSVATVVQAPEKSNLNHATVSVSITYLQNGKLRVIQDVASVFPGNTKEPYCDFPVATASTMAESRCYRKGLRLVKVLSADEATMSDKDTRDAIEETEKNEPSPFQINMIRANADKLGTDLDKTVEYLFGKPIEINKLSYEQVRDIIVKQRAWLMTGENKGGENTPAEIIKN